MIEIGTITLYREKSVVRRIEELNEDEEGAAPPALIMRSNRITIPIKTKVNTVMAVVRGQNIPGTISMDAVVVDGIRRDANVLSDPVLSIGTACGGAGFPTTGTTITTRTGCRCISAARRYSWAAKAARASLKSNQSP
jgi:hypothetical protein